MNVLSIQSGVVYGHVGNSAAVFTLQRLGHEVWPVDTVRFSNHPGHGGLRGRVTPAADMADLIEGLAERGWLGRTDAVLTGYLGAADQGPVAVKTAARVREVNPRAFWVLDPVIGDRGRVFVNPGIPEFIRNVAAPHADVLTPNAFELEFLTGMRLTGLAAALAAAQRLRTAGSAPARLVVVTGLDLAEFGPDTLTTLAVTATAAWRVTVPRIVHPSYGAGDVFAALLTARLLTARDDVATALAAATSAVHAIIAASAAAGSDELCLIEAQDQLVRPGSWFKPIPVG